MSSSGGSWTPPDPLPGPRASDVDRDKVLARLRDAAGNGEIDLNELEERLEAMYAAKTKNDLALITADLPAPQVPPPAATEAPKGGTLRKAWRDASFRVHTTVYGATNGFLVGVWALSGGGEFWPFYPAAGWGIAIVGHAAASAAAVDYKYKRAQRRHEKTQRRPGQQRRRAERQQHRAERLDRHTARKQLPPQAAADVQRAIEQAQRAYAKAREKINARLPEELPIPESLRDLAAQGPPPAAPPTPPVPPVPPTPQTSPPTAAESSEPPAADGPADEPVRRRASDVQRRFVVALFVDVVGSTQLNEVMGDEGWARVRSKLRETFTSCLEANGGWEANSSGDGVLARFEQPEGAAQAAIDILRRLDSQRAESGFAPSVRIGIHSGDAVDEGQDIIGTVVNIAARVSDAAEPDEILVTEHVADHLGSGVQTTGRGLHTLKGITRPRHLLAVEWR